MDKFIKICLALVARFFFVEKIAVVAWKYYV